MMHNFYQDPTHLQPTTPAWETRTAVKSHCSVKTGFLAQFFFALRVFFWTWNILWPDSVSNLFCPGLKWLFLGFACGKKNRHTNFANLINPLRFGQTRCGLVIQGDVFFWEHLRSLTASFPLKNDVLKITFLLGWLMLCQTSMGYYILTQWIFLNLILTPYAFVWVVCTSSTFCVHGFDSPSVRAYVLCFVPFYFLFYSSLA